ncbi:MAG TPA: branched-chain amino acid ABC transporter permease [Thermomicrobiales bacterium]|nr:branched-chain amino acid ABC transporter permease [Thermomicrobiales bacterium]
MATAPRSHPQALPTAPAPATPARPLVPARPRDRRGPWAALLTLLALGGFVWLAETSFNAYRLQLVVLVLIYAIVAVALAVTSGFTGVFSLGQIGFLAIGAYVAALMTIPPIWKDDISLPGLPPWLAAMDLSGLPPQLALLLACLAGGLASALIAAVVGAPLMRLSGHYVAVATMGFLIIVYTLIVNADTVTSGSRGLSQIPTLTSGWSAFGWCALAVYVAWRLRTGPAGRAMIASRENVLAARGVGIDVLRTRLLAFVVGAFFTGVAGALLAHQIGTIAPSQFYFQTTFVVVTMVVLGGMGSITGAVVGATIMTVLPEYLRSVDEGFAFGAVQTGPLYGLSQIVLAVGFILVMIFRPSGLFGDRELGLGLLSRRRRNDGTLGDDAAVTPDAAPGLLDATPDGNRT